MCAGPIVRSAGTCVVETIFVVRFGKAFFCHAWPINFLRKRFLIPPMAGLVKRGARWLRDGRRSVMNLFVGQLSMALPVIPFVTMPCWW